MSVFTKQELIEMGVQTVGDDVRISKMASIYAPGLLSVGDHVRVDDFCILSGRIHLGDYIHIAAYSALFGGREGIVVEDFANISSRVAIYALSDDYSGNTMTNPMIPEMYKNVDYGRVVIGRHCIVGTASTIMPHVEIGEGCAFGAYSFVKNSCEPWGLYAGIPCRRISERSDRLLMFENQMIKESCEK